MARRRHKTPRRGAHGRFVKSNPVRRHRRARRNTYLANPRRRHARRVRRVRALSNPRRHYRRRARRNPPMFSGNRILGLSFNELAYAGIGFIAPPAIEGFAKGFLPTALTSTTIGRYALKVGTVAGLSLLGGKFINREAGKYIAIGGATYILANVVVEFLPALFGGFKAYMNPGTTFQPAQLRTGLRAQPYLGMYQGLGMTPAKLPERIDPNARF